MQLDRGTIIGISSGVLILVLVVVLYITKVWPFGEGVKPKNREKYNNNNNNTTPALVLFYADWCHYCKSMMEDWDKLASEKSNDKSVNIVKLESKDSGDMMKKYGVTGFPTIYYCPKGLGDVDSSIQYNGDRSHDSILNFLNSKSKSS